MNLNNYQTIAMRYSPEGHDRIHYGCMGLIGESGEVVDVVKKQMFRSDAANGSAGEDLIEELGDVMWYLAELATGMGLRLEDALDIGFKSPVRDGEIENSLEKAAVRLAELSIKCYTQGMNKGDRRIMRVCMRKIYAVLRRIAQIAGIPVSVIIDRNIRKQQQRYPTGYPVRR